MARRLLFLAAAFVLAAFVAWAIYPSKRRAPLRPAIATPPPISAIASSSPIPQPSATVATPTAVPSAGQVRVAIIIDDCGQWLSIERQFLQIPIPLTLSVLPYLRYTQQIANDASAAGKGVMLHLPMQPLGRDTSGPGEIKTFMSDAAITTQTQADLAQVPFAKGMNNHEGSKATADARVMRDVIAVAKANGLFFIDSRTSVASIGAQTAQAQGVAQASRDVFLDDRADIAYTEKMLAAAVEIAKRNGSAIAIGHPKLTTLNALRASYAKMESEGVQFVLASELTN